MPVPRASTPETRILRLLRLGVCAFIACWAVAQAQAATLGKPWRLEEAAAGANLIAEGVITAITFRDSDSQSAAAPAIPHSFVTWRIERVIFGNFAEQSITLRFMGGMSPETGRITLVPHGAFFRVGDRDILLIANNGRAACPLVACGLGRFRIWEDLVHDTGGRALRLGADNRLRAGPERMPRELLAMEFPPAPPQRLQEVEDLLASGNLSSEQRAMWQRRLRDMSVPRVIGPGEEIEQTGITIPPEPVITVEAFTALLRRLLMNRTAPPRQEVSADPDQPFSVPAQELQPARPPSRIARPPGRELTHEQQLLRRNGGNPVLRPQ